MAKSSSARNVDGQEQQPLTGRSETAPAHKGKVSNAPPFEARLALFAFAFAFGLLLLVIAWMHIAELAQPNISIRVVRVEGLDMDPHTPPPAFHLAIDKDRVSHTCSGGGSSMLRVSYHDMVLAWGPVPWSCFTDSRSVAVVAKAEGVMLREELRGLVLSEQRVLGRAEFAVEGHVAGLGYLRCKAALFLDGDSTSSNQASCLLQGWSYGIL